MLLIKDLKLGLQEEEDKLKKIVEKRLRTKVQSFEIKKKSLDARKEPIYVYSVLVEVENEDRYICKNIQKYKKVDLKPIYQNANKTVIVIGYGPSGIFAAYRLIEAGYHVLVFEKGKRIKERALDVKAFFETGVLNENSNVQFGEGGAGTFSDAKLTTRIQNPYIDYILDIFIKHGAKPSIAYEHHPHIGTDAIQDIITNITDTLIAKGCEFHFEEEIKDFVIENGQLVKVVSHLQEYEADYFLLGIGHSAYSTILSLKKAGVYMESKDIALGFRVEHPQSFINERQTSCKVEEANEYLLRYKGEKGVYSFCMCPGGIVIPAMSDYDSVVTNGMSYAKRDSGIANSAILIQVPSNEFEDGFVYLKEIEAMAYLYSNSYKALAQNIQDFMNKQMHPLHFKSTYPLGTILYDYNNFFCEKDCKIIKEALLDFDKKIPGFIEKGIMVGPETRSSCPVRIKRNEMMESVNVKKLYPMGEGAGYGGGIMSCALDGIKVSNIIMEDGKI